MLFNFAAFFYSLVFFIGLQLVVFQSDWIVTLSVLIAFLTVQATRKIGKNLSWSVTPLIFALSTVMLLYLVDSMAQRQYLIVLSTVVYYLAFLGIYRLRYYERDLTAQGMLAFTVMATSFLFYSGVYGIYLNFAVPIWGLMLSYCIATGLLSYQYFVALDTAQGRRARIYSLLLGLSMAEIAWVVNFWPFGYLTTGVVALLFYFILWYLVQSYFLEKLTYKKILAHLALFFFLIGMVLSSTQWVPVV